MNNIILIESFLLGNNNNMNAQLKLRQVSINRMLLEYNKYGINADVLLNADNTSEIGKIHTKITFVNEGFKEILKETLSYYTGNL